MELLARTEALLGDLIAFPTVSSDSNLELIAWAANYLEGFGARCEIMSDVTGLKANLLATFGPEGNGGLVLAGHTDVVPIGEESDWSGDPFSMREENDLLYGRGTCDMKGFIACVMALAPEIARWHLKTPVHVALTYDEEVGCFGARALVTELLGRGMRPGMAILGEPTLMNVVDGHKGCYEYTTHFCGCEGHGSAPDRGVNAASCATRYAGRLLELEAALKSRAPEASPFEPPWTTLNIGRMSAGTARNVIAGLAEIEWEMRPVSFEDAAWVLSEIDAYADLLLPDMRRVTPDDSIVREVIGEVAGLMPERDNRIAELVCSLTGANGTEVVSFGTEAGLFQSLGTQCIVCGPGSIQQAHRPDEFVARSQLDACLTMLRGMEGALH